MDGAFPFSSFGRVSQDDAGAAENAPDSSLWPMVGAR